MFNISEIKFEEENKIREIILNENNLKEENSKKEINLPKNISLKKASPKDSEIMFEYGMITLDKSLQNDPKTIRWVENDVKNSLKNTRMIKKNEETIGMITSYEIENKFWYIADIYIEEKYRGNGIGTALLKNEILNHDKLILQVSEKNKKAIKLYKSLGFELSKYRTKDKMYEMRLYKDDIYDKLPKIVECTMDRPMGYIHHNIPYPINYGYVNGIIGGDGEEQDVYVLGVDKPINKFKGKIIAVIHRLNDNEDKWIACPEEMNFSKKEIKEKTAFMEKFFKSEIIMLNDNYPDKDFNFFYKKKIIKNKYINENPIIDSIYNEVSKFSYGVLNNNKVETNEDKFNFQYMINMYKTLTEKEEDKYKTGICLDHSFYISRKLTKNNIKNELFFICGYWKQSNLCLNHVFCIAEINNTYYYIETAAGNYNGIYDSNNKKELLNRVVKMIKENGKDVAKQSNLKIGNFSYDLLNIKNNIPMGHTKYIDSFKYFYENGNYIINQNCKEYFYALSNYYEKQPFQLNENIAARMLFHNQKEVTLYHGNHEFYKTLKPVGINFGNRLEKPSWSIFCFRNFEFAKNWAAFKCILELHRAYRDKYNVDIKRGLIFDPIKNIAVCKEEAYEDIKNILIGNKIHNFYVYEFKVPIEDVGIGNDSTHDEYTVNKEIKDYKLYKFKITKSNLNEFLIPLSDEEMINLEINSRKYAHRGLYSLLYDKDYKLQDRDFLLTIRKDKKLIPGEDIEKWMNKNNYSFNKTLRIPYINEDIGNESYIQEILSKYPENKIYLGSDWHLFKKEVVGDPAKESNFNLNKYSLIHNSIVGKNDIFIYLGDLAHRRCNEEHYERLRNFLNKLNGIKILIRGNHDLQSDDYYLSCGFSFVLDHLRYKNILFSHKPIKISEYPGCKLNIHGHLHQYKVYWSDIKPKNHLGLYTPNHKPITLEYVLNHKDEIESENIDIFKEKEKHLALYEKYVKLYIKYIEKFYKRYPEYKYLSMEEKYKYQTQMVKDFLEMPETRINDELVGWDQVKMLNSDTYKKLTYKFDTMENYHHCVIFNKDNSLMIDLIPELIDEKNHIYSFSKNLERFMYSSINRFALGQDVRIVPQDRNIKTMIEKKPNLKKYLNESINDLTDLQKIEDFYNKIKDFEYGFISNGKRYAGDILDEQGAFNKYKTMSLKTIKEHRICVCWDAVLYEAYWFKKNLPNISFKCYYCEYEPNIGNTHTWLVFNYKGENYVFEQSWRKHQGVNKMNKSNKNTINQYIHDIPHDSYNLKNFSNSELQSAKYVLFEYDPLSEKTGLTCAEFMDSKWFNGKFITTNCKNKKELFDTFQFNAKEKEKLKKSLNFKESYEPPYSLDEIRKNYGKNYYDKLSKDPIHKWRAETGIELIHKEPTIEELNRIMKNWELMDEMKKKISDKKSIELFGCTNRENYNKLINSYNETLETRISKPISNFQKMVTLYHGTRTRIPNGIIDPAHGIVNTGTRISKPRYSTWWAIDPFFPYYFSTSGTMTKLVYDLNIIPKGTKIGLTNMTKLLMKFFILNHKNQTLYINEKYKKEVINAINKNPGYVYYITVPWNIVGRGHDITLDEFTLDVPVKAEEDIVDFNKLCEYVNVEFIPEEELILLNKEITSKGNHFNKPNFMEKLLYRSIEERVRLGKIYSDITKNN